MDPIARLIQALGRLPGIGEKTATRLAFHLLRADKSYVQDLAEAILDASKKIGLCQRCMALTDRELCAICQDARRDGTVLCVVEEVADLQAIERTREYRGRYHVLHGAIAPLEGIGPEQIRLKELLTRLSTPEESGVQEIIIATNPSVEGEATALYLQRLLRPLGLRLTRIASGMPIGGDFQYADPATIARALTGRREMS
ncbi:MAG: recombination protein RecR [Deltaproteobacteria bacterium]|nr:recombination protein RecR [Deltaproteobacteria bacterium]